MAISAQQLLALHGTKTTNCPIEPGVCCPMEEPNLSHREALTVISSPFFAAVGKPRLWSIWPRLRSFVQVFFAPRAVGLAESVSESARPRPTFAALGTGSLVLHQKTAGAFLRATAMLQTACRRAYWYSTRRGSWIQSVRHVTGRPQPIHRQNSPESSLRMCPEGIRATTCENWITFPHPFQKPIPSVGQLITASPRRYRASSSFDRSASIRRTSRRFPLIRAIFMSS